LTTNPENPQTDEGLPGAALVREADRLASALDDYRHHLSNSPYTGSDTANTVEATVTANFRITELIIEDRLLPLGAEVVAERVLEALVNAQAAATQGRQDRSGELSGALGLNAELKEQFESALKDIRPNHGIQAPTATP
jgi:DNA-binding protein YbaB